MPARILFISQQHTSFVREDLATLSERYDVRSFVFGGREASAGKGVAGLIRSTADQYRWLMRELPQADLVYGWFADYHMALPVRMAKASGIPSAVVLGGFDANVVPDLDYGVFGSAWRGPLARYVVRNASQLFPVGKALIYNENAYAAPPAVLKNGVAYHVPGFRTPYAVIPTGYDPAIWPPGDAVRAASVCTVAYLGRERDVRIKGVDLFIEAARLLPEVAFRVVGVPDSFKPSLVERYRPPANVELIPPQDRQGLAALYGNASVYAQLSRSEGLPNVLCEAMMCGCVPVVSRVSEMPDVVEGVGFVVDTPNPDRIVETIVRALGAGASARFAARDRIAARYSNARRRAALYEALDGMLASASEAQGHP